MFTSQKQTRKSSSRAQINVQSVQDGVLLLSGGKYRMVLEASSLNFELKSEAEQDALIDTYESFLNSLPCPLQIIVRIRELDMTKYIDELGLKKEQEKVAIYRSQIQNYSDFVQELVSDNKILSRHFYIVLPYTSKADEFDAAKERLLLNADLVSKGLNRMGIQTRMLGSLEVLDLFHSYYNQEQSKRQPLTDSVVRMLSSMYTKKESL